MRVLLAEDDTMIAQALREGLDQNGFVVDWARDGEQARLALASGKDIDLGIAAAEAALVSGDRETLRVLLGNLIDNAIRYTSPGGCVNVSILPDGNRVRLEVDDTGAGIPPAERARIRSFLPRARKPRTGQRPGPCDRPTHR